MMLCTLMLLLGLTEAPVAEPADPSDLPLFSIEQLQYVGAFRIPADTFGESSANYASGVIAYNPHNHSLFLAGHTHHRAIAEFKIPEIVNSTRIEDLQMATPIQPFVRILSRLENNPDGLDRITGMHYDHGRLIVNAIKYYDASGRAQDTTIVIPNADSLTKIETLQAFRMEGAARAAGWISPLPKDWREPLDGDLIVGSASGWPINRRLSIGPSAFSGRLRDFIHADIRDNFIPLKTLQVFTLEYPISDDRWNKEGTNKMYTYLSKPMFGFVAPDTRTYVTLGSSGGHRSKVGYKLERSDGHKCPGYCPYNKDDVSHYFWLWDMNNWTKNKEQDNSRNLATPYLYGELGIPFPITRSKNAITGGSFDKRTNTLYLTIDRADDKAGRYRNPPLILVYSLH